MDFVRRFWIAGLVLSLVVAHAAILGYVRSQIARIKNVQSTTVLLGSFRFQSSVDPSTVYSFDLHGVLLPTQRLQGEDLIGQYRVELHEQIEQTLRQVDVAWLADPEQSELRLRVRDLITERLKEPVVERVVITNWLKLPVSQFTPEGSLVAAKTSPVAAD